MWSRELLRSEDVDGLEQKLSGRDVWPIDDAHDDGQSSRTTLMRSCMVASQLGERMVGVLLAHGADPSKGYFDETEEEWLEDWDEEFEDELHAPSLALVAAKRAAVERRKQGTTAAALGQQLRVWAATSDAVRVEDGAELLLAGADVNETDAEGGGKTALILACERGLAPRVRLLLSKGAAAGQPSNGGPHHTPLWHAHMGQVSPDLTSAASEHDVVIHMLRTKGQKLSDRDDKWFRDRAARGPPQPGEVRGSGDADGLHEPPPAQRQRVEPPPPAAQQPQPHRAAGAPAQSSGGWGSFANTEPRAEWEEFKGKLYTNNAPNVYKCLICATAGEMTGREAFVMHIEGKRHHQVVVGSGGGGGTAGYERGVPPHDPMRVLTERMHHEMMRRQDEQQRQNSHVNRLNSELASGGAAADAAGDARTAVGDRETEEYWRKRLRKQAESNVLKVRELEKRIEVHQAEEIKQSRKRRELEENNRHYADKRRECREQAKEIEGLKQEIETLKQQNAWAKDEARKQRGDVDALSSTLSSMRLDSAQDDREVTRLRSEMAERDQTIALQSEYLDKAREALTQAANQASLHNQPVPIGGGAGGGGGGGESAARIMRLEHELRQQEQVAESQRVSLRQANEDRAQAAKQREQDRLARETLTRENTKLKDFVKRTAQDERKATRERDDAVAQKQQVEQELADETHKVERERRRADTTENELDSLRREGHGKDYSEGLRTATETIAEILADEYSPDVKRAVVDQLLAMLPGGGSGGGGGLDRLSRDDALAARALINFAELLECMAGFSSASLVFQESTEYKREITDAQKAALKAARVSDDWKLPARNLGDLDAEKVYKSLDEHRNRQGSRRFNHKQKRDILADLTRAGSGFTLERNPAYSRNALGEEEFIEMPIEPPLETRERGKTHIDPQHHKLREIEAEYGAGARDAVIKCREEQIEYNDSGNYSVSKVIDPETDKEMLPSKVIERMSTWLPGCVRVQCSAFNEKLTVHITDDEIELKKKLRAQGTLGPPAGTGRRDTAKVYLKPMRPEDDDDRTWRSHGTAEDLLSGDETLQDKIDVTRDIKAGKLVGFALVAVQ